MAETWSFGGKAVSDLPKIVEFTIYENGYSA